MREATDLLTARIGELQDRLSAAERGHQSTDDARQEAECRAENAERRLVELQQRYDQLRSCLIRLDSPARGGLQYVVPNLHMWRKGSTPLEARFDTWAHAEAYLEQAVLVELEHQVQLRPAMPRSVP